MNAHTKTTSDTNRERRPSADTLTATASPPVSAEGGSFDHWKSFWSNCDDPKHRHASEHWIRFYAEELTAYFPRTPVDALEIGCGNGQLYRHFRKRFSSYIGLDYSPQMIASFQKRWPEAQLICCDARSLPDFDSPFDFAVANGFCQYLDHDRLRHHLAAVHERLRGGGVYLLANVPDRELRFLHDGGGLRSTRRFSWRGALRRLRKRMGGRRDGIGHWYRRWELGCLADEGGWNCQTYSSASYEYRFHAKLTKR